jgi:hypothetical protein
VSSFFDLDEDPNELENLAKDLPVIVERLKYQAIQECIRTGITEALDGDQLKAFEYEPRKLERIYQFACAGDAGAPGFPTPAQRINRWKHNPSMKAYLKWQP